MKSTSKVDTIFVKSNRQTRKIDLLISLHMVLVLPRYLMSEDESGFLFESNAQALQLFSEQQFFLALLQLFLVDVLLPHVGQGGIRQVLMSKELHQNGRFIVITRQHLTNILHVPISQPDGLDRSVDGQPAEGLASGKVVNLFGGKLFKISVSKAVLDSARIACVDFGSDWIIGDMETVNKIFEVVECFIYLAFN